MVYTRSYIGKNIFVSLFFIYASNYKAMYMRSDPTRCLAWFLFLFSFFFKAKRPRTEIGLLLRVLRTLEITFMRACHLYTTHAAKVYPSCTASIVITKINNNNSNNNAKYTYVHWPENSFAQR